MFSSLRHTCTHTHTRPSEFALWSKMRQAQKHLRGILKLSVSAVLVSESLITDSQQQRATRCRYHQRAASRWEKSTASAQSQHHSGAYAGSHGFCGGEQSQRNTCWISKTCTHARMCTHTHTHTMEIYSLLRVFFLREAQQRVANQYPQTSHKEYRWMGRECFSHRESLWTHHLLACWWKWKVGKRGSYKAAFKRWKRNVQCRLLPL